MAVLISKLLAMLPEPFWFWLRWFLSALACHRARKASEGPLI